MQLPKIDWSRLWKEARAREKRRKGPDVWDRRAPSFAKHASKSPYVREFIRILSPEPSWSVLDVGSGPGTLAIPLADKVREITAIDFSGAMIELLKKECACRGIKNITAVKASWEDDWNAVGIWPHDVAIASRSIVVDDLEAALLKLDGIARKQVYISAPVGDGPMDRRLFEAVGRDFPERPDYIYVYNLLHQLGILADVTFITLRDKKTYDSFGEAFESNKWMFDNITPEEEERLENYLKDHLAPEGGGLSMSYERLVRWAVISWKKQA
ncbi:class I SAM-dependent methyltransferase [Dissulfurimicrobium hydrothermale]|uniref:class I SAM-dependent methyltransferase n=1 Tax=Dissulfurimicrobium hydrothermale TaxID=1750598 RepID=UPI001EDABA94|nr:class I SAM-dependent methyltransferase [Dissulfurimicrobium hydrothermale]UKL14293.1 class I SAM-dependent methyltransferase [Dissulfurimicrobium hydrothermale]